MSLVLKKHTKPSTSAKSDVAGLHAIELDAERVQLMGIKTARVLRESLGSRVRSVGFVAPDENAQAKITTRFSGWIEHLYVSEMGQQVTKGQVLATIYSPDLLAAQQEFLNALRWSKEPHTEAESLVVNLAADARRKLHFLGISEGEIAQLERSLTPRRTIKVISPVSGYITQKNAMQGLFAEPGTELFEIADLAKVWVLADVSERDISRVNAALPAKLSLAAYPGETFIGTVQFVYPAMNSQTRTLRVRLEFSNEDLRLRPGMYGEVIIDLPPVQGLTIPSESLVDTGDLQYVFVAQEGGRFEPRRVVVGSRSDNRVRILSGLADGETVVTKANFLLDSESRLRTAIEGNDLPHAGVPKE